MKKILQLLVFVTVCMLSLQTAEAQYCIPYYYYAPTGSCSYINRVKLNTIDYTSGAGTTAYNDFSDHSTVLTPGGSYNITLYDGGCGDYYMVWIDYDQSGTFDYSERILSDETYSYSSFTSSFMVPGTTLPG